MAAKASKPFTAFLLVALGTGMNAARGVQRGKNPMSTILGGVVFGTICVGLNDLSDERFGTLLAGIFLLSSTLTSGVSFIETLADLSTSYE